MNIPARLADLLALNQELDGAVNITLHDFRIWFEDRNLVFFPEYTDHGPKHIDEVMATAAALVTDESWELLTPEDAAVLILSIILHDCAMHLSEEGFIALVNPSTPRPSPEEFEEKPWPELWANFLSEASRFDARKLRAIFGDTEPVHRPPLDAREMRLRDRLLIGEFLRRHHPRLAHEIALWGVPGPDDDRIGLVRAPTGLANIAGLCARSHGLPLRESVEVIPRLQRREHLKVHVPFLMSVLRVADYIQIHSERAPKQVLKVRSLKSPVSQGEWKAHDAVEDIHCTHDDPEAIVVIAKPKDVRTFLKLERLLSGLQEELDASWAVLGEVYGRVRGLQDLGLAIRRVRSNLDDKAAFASTVSYHPDRVIFEADPEILKLLIAPLYGDKPGIAIRELLQNAVDACLEARDYLNKVSPGALLEETSSKASVLVHLEEEEEKGGWLTVSDGGIGMTSEVVKNYFLKAGASFRRSEAWKALHETSAGKSRVLRSGRFGIGILAAFLLGDRLEVTTRHVTAPPEAGIQFSCSIDDEEIELRRVTLPALGTSIRVRISREVFNKLNAESTYYSDEGIASWDWYHLQNPSVERRVTVLTANKKTSTTLKPTYVLPSSLSELPAGWNRIHHGDFKDIHWHYPPRSHARRQEDNFFCNGIKIGDWDTYTHEEERKFQWPFSMKAPVISVFDPDGKLPLNLERSALTRPLPFERELAADVCRDLIAYLLVRAPKHPLLNSETAKDFQRIFYPGFRDYDDSNRSEWFWATSRGLSLATRWSLHSVSPKNLYILPRLSDLQFDIPEEYANVYCCGVNSTLERFDRWVRFVSMGVMPTGYRSDYAGWLENTEVHGRRIMISTEYEDRVRRHKSLPKRFLSHLTEEWKNDTWLVLSTKGCPKPSVDFRRFAEKAKPGITSAVGEWYIKSVPLQVEELVEEVWKANVSEPSIPFSPAERKKRLAETFDKLSSHLNFYQSKSKNG